jgi:hypothetical protein
MTSTTAGRRLEFGLAVVAAAAFAVAVDDLVAGGFRVVVLGFRLSSWDAFKPFRIGVIATTAALSLHDFRADARTSAWSAIERLAPWLAVVTAIASVAMGVRFGIFVAGGADPYAYVNEAHVLASGRLTAVNPLAALEADLGNAVATPGYEVGRTPGTMAPTFALGLPLTMALALKIGGANAVFYVAPLLGGLAVWLTYVLGRRTFDAIAALIAAVFLTFSPIFVFETFQPMTDVPATAWWMLAWAFATLPAPWTAAAAGLAVSAAVLTRPNLVPLAIVLALVVARSGPRALRVILFATGAVPGCAAVAAFNAALFGSPLSSGYGSAAALYAWNHWADNLRRYGGWLIQFESPIVLLAFAAPLVAASPWIYPMLVFCAIVLASYLFYIVFAYWPFLRFLLPALPLLWILASGVLVWIVHRLPVTIRSTAVFLLCVLMPLWFVAQANRVAIFGIYIGEQRYRTVGEYVGRALPPNAVVIGSIESGSLQFYGSRPSLRWEHIPYDDLDRALALLGRHSYEPYVVAEDSEEDDFRSHFAAKSALGRLDWPPLVEYRGTASVRIYRPADRQQHLAGRPVATTIIKDR